MAGCDQLDQRTVGAATRHDSRLAGDAPRERAALAVETQTALFLFRPVAREAMLLQDGTHFAAEVHAVRRHRNEKRTKKEGAERGTQTWG